MTQNPNDPIKCTKYETYVNLQNRMKYTKYETCANLHRFHIWYVSCGCTPLQFIKETHFLTEPVDTELLLGFSGSLTNCDAGLCVMSDVGLSGGLTDWDVGLGGRLLGLLGTDPGDGLLGAGGGLSASARKIIGILRPQQINV